jgi:hypothetical protein
LSAEVGRMRRREVERRWARKRVGAVRCMVLGLWV